MKFIVFHVFSGSKEALAKNTGGVETFLNNMLKNNLRSDIYSIVVGRQYQFIPQIITNVKPKEPDQKTGQKIFPYFTYLLSNLILGISISLLLSIQHLRQKKPVNREVIHVHDPIIGATLFLFSPKFLTGTTYVSQFHSEYRHRLEIMLPRTLLSQLTLRLYSFFEKVCIRRADVIIAVNENIRKYLIGMGCPIQKIEKIPIFIEPSNNPNSFDLSKYLSSLGVARGQFIITYIGRLSKEKNLEVLLSSFLSLDLSFQKNLTLLIVGAGDQLNNVKSLIAPISNRVRLLGHRSDVNFILCVSDIFILPSLTEGFPFSLLEAMSNGKTIIASNIPPIAEIVRNEREAILFDPRSPKELSAAIMRLYANSGLRKNLGLNAKEKAKQYDVTVIISMILQCYKKSSNFGH